MLPIFALPETLTDVNIPTEVILGCAAVVNAPVNLVADKVPVATLKDRLALDANARLLVLLELTKVG